MYNKPGRTKSILLAIAMIFAVSGAAPAVASPQTTPTWGPWQEADARVLPAEAYHRAEKLAGTSTGSALPLLFLLRTYQVLLSSQDAGRCPMYPSCSRFAMLAIEQNGLFTGLLLIASRLQREGQDLHGHYRQVRVGDRLLYEDLPEDQCPW